jgi:hypothetical protein
MLPKLSSNWGVSQSVLACSHLFETQFLLLWEALHLLAGISNPLKTHVLTYVTTLAGTYSEIIIFAQQFPLIHFCTCRQDIFGLNIFRYQTLAIFFFCVDFHSLACNHTPPAQPIPAVKIILVPKEKTGYFWLENFQIPDFSHFSLLCGFPLNSLQTTYYKLNTFLLSKLFWYQWSIQWVFGLNIFRYQTLAIFPFCVDFPSLACNHTLQAQPIPSFKVTLVQREQTGYFWVEKFQVPDFSHFPLLCGFSLISLQPHITSPTHSCLQSNFGTKRADRIFLGWKISGTRI